MVHLISIMFRLKLSEISHTPQLPGNNICGGENSILNLQVKKPANNNHFHLNDRAKDDQFPRIWVWLSSIINFDYPYFGHQPADGQSDSTPENDFEYFV